MLGKDRYKTTSGSFVIPLFSQLWEEKNYFERRNELSSWRPVALTNCHKHLCLFKLGYDVHALLSSVMYILSGKMITAVYPMSRRRWDQNTTQVDNRLDRARLHTYGCSIFPPWTHHPYIDSIATNPCQARAPWLYFHVYNECLSTGITLISRWESPPGSI